MAERANRYRDLCFGRDLRGIHNSAFSVSCLSKCLGLKQETPLTFKERNMKLAMALDQILKESFHDVDSVK